MTEASLLRLRRLAGTYAEYALSDVMTQRRKKWRLNNGLKERTFPFHIEDNGTFFRDVMPPLQCPDSGCHWLEWQLLFAITAYERINDDRIIPDRFVVDWALDVGKYCEELNYTHVDDGHGGSFGYETNKPIQDIDADFHKLKHRTVALNRDWTGYCAEMAREVFKGLLPVEVGRPHSFYSDGFTNKAVHLMGMEELYLQMAINPEAVHRLFAFLVEDNLALGQWEEDQGILTLNNDGNQGYCSGSSQFSDEIPGRILAPGEPVRSADRYGYLEAQEASSISPDMFAEFLMPHFRKLASKFKLMKFGCCEPVHAIIGHLQELNGLRKVSVTPWCDLEKLAAACNRNVIWSRKSVPLKLCGTTFDPADFRAHVKETLDVGANFFIEFVFRDNNLLTGAMQDRLDEACRIVRDITGHPEGAR
jgi:hypothetical protein